MIELPFMLMDNINNDDDYDDDDDDDDDDEVFCLKR